MITGSLQYLKDKNREYFTNFQLYPKSVIEPEILDAPIDVFRQSTWVSSIVYDNNVNKYYAVLQNKPQILNTVEMTEGTAFNIKVTAIDPTMLGASNSVYDDKNLQYKWLKNDGILYEYSNINNFKGTNELIITSESCTRDRSGTYRLSVTNIKTGGTTLSQPITINVLDLKTHPILYKNLLKNGCGEQDMDGWSKDSDIVTSRFAINSKQDCKSILPEVYQLGASEYTSEFKFVLGRINTKLSIWFPKNYTPSAGDNDYWRWLLRFKPMLVPTDGQHNTADQSDYFYPSWNYIDTYNKNNNLVKLGDIIKRSQTYITRNKIKFITYGGKPLATAQQTVNISQASNMVDGKVYGIDSVYAHFFAYVGIGISNYKLEYVDTGGNVIEDNLIPTTFYKYKLGILNDKPPFIPRHPEEDTLTVDKYQYYLWATTTDNSSKNPNYNKVLAKKYSTTNRDKYAVKIKEGTKIQLTPVCYDKTNIMLEFLGDDESVIGSETIPGPTERDIWAIKEKFFLPLHIGNLYGWTTNASDQEFWFYSQSFTTMNAILGVDNNQLQKKDINAEWCKKYYYQHLRSIYDFSLPVGYGRGPGTIVTIKKPADMANESEAKRNDNLNYIDTVVNSWYKFNKNFLYNEENGITRDGVKISLGSEQGTRDQYDHGAAAFFAVQRDIEIPTGTRFIRATIMFSHASDAMQDENPKIKDWSKQTIYYDVFSKNSVSEQRVDYGNPRCAVTAMHLSLHPNAVIAGEDYNTYQVNLSGSVWDMELKRLESVNEFNSVVDQSYQLSNLQYRYNTSTMPVQQLNTYTEQQSSVANIAIQYPGIEIVNQLPLSVQIPNEPPPVVESAIEDTQAYQPIEISGSIQMESTGSANLSNQ